MPAIDAGESEWLRYRRELAAGQTSLQALCATLGLRLATERLAGFAHWVTPSGPPRRYDTRFFVAVAPPEQTASHDDAEAVAHVWIRPSDALDRARGGDLRLVFATTTTMTWLAGFNSTSAVMAQARVPRSIPVHEPRAARAGDAKRVLIRSHEAYAEVCRLDPLGQGTASCELASGMQTLLAPSVRRIVAAGVNSYVVGLGDGAVVIDPGPDDRAHREALLRAAGGTIASILLAHAGPAHAAGASALKGATGAALMALPCAASGFAPDRIVAHGERLDAGGVSLRALHAGDAQARGFLHEEEHMLFGPDCGKPWLDGVQWHAPAQGFMRDRQESPKDG